MLKENYRLSASQINTFIKDPYIWVLRYYFGLKTGGNLHAFRGQAIEHGVNTFLSTRDIKISKEAMYDSFYMSSKELEHEFEDYLEIEAKLDKWFDNSLGGLLPYVCVELPKLQTQLDFEIEGLPFIGFLDYEFEDRVVDLKTTGKIPKILVRGPRAGSLEAFKKDNLRQQAIYQYVNPDKEHILLYTTPNSGDVNYLNYTLKQEEYEHFIVEVEEAVREIKKVLTGGLDYVKLNYKPNKGLYRSFYYNQEMIAKAEELSND